MHPELPLAQSICAALGAARSRDAARAAIVQVREARVASNHEIRAALASIVRDPGAMQGMVWLAVEVAREEFEALDATLDRALVAHLSRAPLQALAVELDACGPDHDRAHRALDSAWRHLAPPGSRAAASLVDLVRAHPLGPARAAVYAYLVGRGADVRGPLADDALLPAAERIRVLCDLAARRADGGKSKPVPWRSAPATAMARALADWTTYATHPRQLFYWYRRHAGLLDDAAYATALDEIARWPLAIEVRAHCERERAGEPRLLPARGLGSGRYECGRCGDSRVAVSTRRALEESDPSRGVETEFACFECNMRYFATWESATVAHAAAPVPQGWDTA